MKFSQLFFILAVLCGSQLQASDSWLTEARAYHIKRMLDNYDDIQLTLWICGKGRAFYKMPDQSEIGCDNTKTDEQNREIALLATKLCYVNAIRKMKKEQPVTAMSLQDMDKFMDRIETTIMSEFSYIFSNPFLSNK